MSALYITSARDEVPGTHPDRGRDILNAAKLNALPGPIMVRMAGGSTWEVIDVEVECAIFRANVGGLSQVMSFCEVMEIIDIEGNTHDPERFWTDWGEA